MPTNRFDEVPQQQSNAVYQRGPPQLPPLYRGQKIQSGPYTVTVTEDMVAERERQNAELYRMWRAEQERRVNSIDDDDDPYAEEFKDAIVRRAFIRKVFCILSLQLLFTAGVIAFFMFVDEAQKFMIMHWYIWVIALYVIYYCSYSRLDTYYSSIIVTFIVFYCAISCSEYARRSSPCKYICLLMLTCAMSYLAAFASVFYGIETVILAFGMTSVITIVICLVATFSKFDLTMRAGLMMIVGIVAIVAIVVILIVLMFTQIRILHLIIAIIGTLLISMYLYFDIQTIMGGRKIQISPDEVVFATTQLYVDIILLYKYALMFMGFFGDN